MEITLKNTLSLFRYHCSECKSKSYLAEFRNAALMNCPFCGADALTYERPTTFLLEKGKTKRKLIFLSMYRNTEGKEFFTDHDPSKSSKFDMLNTEKRKSAHVKDIQTFGIQKGSY